MIVSDLGASLHLRKIKELISAALNRGLSECAAESQLIARMDADDIALPSRLETQTRFMVNNAHVDVLGTAVSAFDNESGQVSKHIDYKCRSTTAVRW